MNAIPKLPIAQQMTVEEFLAFTETRPEGERWELIEGVAVKNPSPIDWHQLIVTNIVYVLIVRREAQRASWTPLIGTGTRVPASPNSLPQPDVMVKEHALTGTPASDDALVVFEVLSRSNTKAWQAWRRRAYPSIPNCQHYVTVSTQRAEVHCYDRSTDWKERSLAGISTTLALPALGLDLDLADIYRNTPIGEGASLVGRGPASTSRRSTRRAPTRCK